MVAGRQDRRRPCRVTAGDLTRSAGGSGAAAWKRGCDHRGDDQADRGSAQLSPWGRSPPPARQPVADDHDANSDQRLQPRSADPDKQRQQEGQHCCQAEARPAPRHARRERPARPRHRSRRRPVPRRCRGRHRRRRRGRRNNRRNGDGRGVGPGRDAAVDADAGRRGRVDDLAGLHVCLAHRVCLIGRAGQRSARGEPGCSRGGAGDRAQAGSATATDVRSTLPMFVTR